MSCSIYYRRSFKMGVVEIICGVIMLAVSILIIITTMMQSHKQQDMSAAISGSASFYTKSGGTTKEQSLAALTRILAIVLFAATLAAHIFSIVTK